MIEDDDDRPRQDMPNDPSNLVYTLRDRLPASEVRTHSVWRLMVGRHGHQSAAVDIIIPNDRPPYRGVVYATERFFDLFNDNRLDEFFDGDVEEWVVRSASILSEEAYL